MRVLVVDSIFYLRLARQTKKVFSYVLGVTAISAKQMLIEVVGGFFFLIFLCSRMYFIRLGLAVSFALLYISFCLLISDLLSVMQLFLVLDVFCWLFLAFTSSLPS